MRKISFDEPIALLRLGLWDHDFVIDFYVRQKKNLVCIAINTLNKKENLF